MRWIWRETRGMRGLTLLASFFGILSIFSSLWFVWTTKHIIDIATGVSADPYPAAICMMATAMGLQLISGASRRRVSNTAFVRFASRLRSRLFMHLLGARWEGRERFHSSDATGRLNGDVATAAGLATNVIPGTLVTLVQLGGAFIFMAWFDIRIALGIAIIMPIALVFSKLYTKQARRLTREIRNEDTTLQRVMTDALRHRTLLLTLPEAGGYGMSMESKQNSLYRLITRRNDISIFSSTAVTLGFMAGYAVAFLWCAGGLMEGRVTFGLMTAFLQLVAQVQRPIVDLAGRYPQFIDAGVARERLEEITSLPMEEGKDEIELPDAPTGIRLEGAEYRYADGEAPVTSPLSHDFEPCTLTSISGETGAGKTTLLMMLLGLAKPSKGRVTVYADGKEIEAGKGTRRIMTYVAQGNSLISGTVRENLRMSAPAGSGAPTEEEMEEALKRAQAGFVMNLPLGLDTPCGERGGGFSEGEAQRIAIARGLLGRGRILILDEPLSALDGETAQRVMETLQEEAQRRTVIMVTHRLVRDEGRIGGIGCYIRREA